MKYLQQDLKQKLLALLGQEFNIKAEEITFTIPTNRKFGDISTALPFIIAKREQVKPFIIGQKIIGLLQGKFPMFSEIKLAAGGFVNFYFKGENLLEYLINEVNRKPEKKNEKIIIEHTSINPNKSAHIGHLRNACIGDTLVNYFKFLGYDVEIQNYLDDTGIQVADVVWGLLIYEGKSLEQIKKIGNLAGYLWDLYSKVTCLFTENTGFAEERNQVHKKIELKINPEYETSDYIATEVLKNHLKIMEDLGIRYDLLVRESDIIELDFFTDAAKILKNKKVMYMSDDPEKKGCWVIKYEKEKIEKIIIRSNNTVTYIGKDLAYSIWKLGLFKTDFYYQKFFTYENGQEIYITDSAPNQNRHQFGAGSRAVNVIGIRQSYLQNIIAQEINKLINKKNKNPYIHFAYEMVSLTTKCMEEMGFEISEEDKMKSTIDVSGRKGIAVKAEELLQSLKQKSLREVLSRDPEIDKKKGEEIATQISIAALRYFMIKYNSNSVIAFDFNDALSFEGDTGPYLQYALVRINSILNKADKTDLDLNTKNLSITSLEDQEYSLFYELLLSISQIETQVELALDKNEISLLAKYTFTICQKFNHYYHLYPILAEKEPGLRKLRFTLILLLKNKLQKLFDLMGIPVPDKM